VSPWKSIASVVFLAIWLPATHHCQLEKLPGLGFLRCATDAGESHCGEDSCDVVEHGAFKAPDTGDLIVFPEYRELTLEVPHLIPEPESDAPASLHEARIPRMSRFDSWECYSSRALAIRGPSLPS
jgi:hypothetical protein